MHTDPAALIIRLLSQIRERSQLWHPARLAMGPVIHRLPVEYPHSMDVAVMCWVLAQVSS